MTQLIENLPIYEPKINENNNEKINLNIRDLQNKYPNGCICCGTTFYPRKFSSLISSHFNTAKHKKSLIGKIELANQMIINQKSYSDIDWSLRFLEKIMRIYLVHLKCFAIMLKDL